MPDPFDLNDTDEGADGGTDSDNKSFAQLRQHARDLEKQLKAVTAEVEPLRAFREETVAERRVGTAREILTELELRPSFAKLFTTVNPEGEVTKEAVVAFAKEYDLIAADAQVDTTPPPATPSTEVASAGTEPEDTGRIRGFEPQTGGSTVVDATDKVGREEWLGLVQSEPAKAERLFNEGRVDMTDVALTRPSSLGA